MAVHISFQTFPYSFHSYSDKVQKFKDGTPTLFGCGCRAEPDKKALCVNKNLVGGTLVNLFNYNASLKLEPCWFEICTKSNIFL